MRHISNELCLHPFALEFLFDSDLLNTGDAVKIFSMLSYAGEHSIGIDHIIEIAFRKFFCTLQHLIDLECNEKYERYYKQNGERIEHCIKR